MCNVDSFDAFEDIALMTASGQETDDVRPSVRTHISQTTRSSSHDPVLKTVDVIQMTKGSRRDSIIKLTGSPYVPEEDSGIVLDVSRSLSGTTVPIISRPDEVPNTPIKPEVMDPKGGTLSIITQ